MYKIEDGHNKLETPVPFPNTEVKFLMLMALVPYKVPNHQAVFHYFYIISFFDSSMKKVSKSEAKKEIDEFFENIQEKTPEEVKKIKKLAMRHNIQLKDKRKLFCKKCLYPYKNPSIRIKKDILSITCDNCNYISRWKVN